MNKKGWIIYNGHLPGSKFLDFAEWISDAAAKRNSETIIYQNNELLSVMSENELDIVHAGKQSLPAYVVFTDKDIYLAKQLELLGIPVFNSAYAIAASDDKILTYQELAKNHIPMPRTMIAPKIFANTSETDADYISLAIHTFGFPMIVKEAFGSFGEQVYLVKNRSDLHEVVKEIAGKPFLFQEFITSSYGRDIRLHVVGDRVVAAMERQSASDFRANVTAGGTMTAYEPTAQDAALAVRATKAIGADFAGVDLLYGSDGNSLVCEVNSNAHIRNMYDCTKINVADYMINYILEALQGDV